jgi:tRNA U34 5-methylaminomethyl-2-thiouridine-forming methyltransferase MnmC
MSEPRETAKLRWEDGVPVSARFDDPYYARSDGLAESRHVFLDGNDLPRRFKGAKAFRVAELGFGTGLNVLAALQAWHRLATPDGILHFTSFEQFPLTPNALEEALLRFPDIAPFAGDLTTAYRAFGPDGPAQTSEIALPRAHLTLIIGDARTALPKWQGMADAWFLDGFAPARNPEMWTPDLLHAVASHTAPGGTFATYSAAGAVRRTLQEAGFTVEKRPGFGRKRDMAAGQIPL